jgi:sulfur carrier protein ThiS
MITNTLSSLNFEKIGNIVLTNSDFVPRLQQVLVREQYNTDPINLICEKDPIDAAVDIIRCKCINAFI